MVKEDTQIEGALTKPYRLWRVDAEHQFVAVVAEADSIDEIRLIGRRSDWRYQVTRNGAPVNAETGYPILRAPGQDLTANE